MVKVCHARNHSTMEAELAASRLHSFTKAKMCHALNHSAMEAVNLMSVLHFAVCTADFLFIIDRSGSICNDEQVETCNNWERVKTFMLSLVGSLTIGPDASQVAVVSFGSSATVEFYLNA